VVDRQRLSYILFLGKKDIVARKMFSPLREKSGFERSVMEYDGNLAFSTAIGESNLI
jgi:hypothetical protein